MKLTKHYLRINFHSSLILPCARFEIEMLFLIHQKSTVVKYYKTLKNIKTRRSQGNSPTHAQKSNPKQLIWLSCWFVLMKGNL